MNFRSILALYDYSFPKNLIAQIPAKPRDSARLLVFDRRTRRITHTTFRDLPKYIQPNSVLVLNNTKVISARLEVYKSSGGRVKLLYLSVKNGNMTVLSNVRLRVGDKLSLTPKRRFIVMKHHKNCYELQPNFDVRKLDTTSKLVA